MYSIKANTLLRLLLVAATSTAVTSCPAPVVAQNDDEVRESFREFYEPLWPELQTAWSQGRFRCFVVQPNREQDRVNFFSGAIGPDALIYDSWHPFWTSQSELDFDGIAAAFPAREERHESWILLPDSSYRAQHLPEAPQIRSYPNRDWTRFYNPDSILTPTWAVGLLVPFHQLIEDRSIEFHAFTHEPRGEFDVAVKRLQYRPRLFPARFVFEAVFDARTGVCLASSEYQRRESGDDWSYLQRSFQLEFQDDNEGGQRRLARVSVTEPQMRLTRVLHVIEFQPDDTLNEDDFTVQAFGLDESLLQQNEDEERSLPRGHPLVTIAMILAGLILLVLALTGLLTMLMRLSRDNSVQAEKHAARPLPQPPAE